MTCVQEVKAARNPSEALLVLARYVDKLEARLNEQPADDGWGSWDVSGGFAVVASADVTLRSAMDDNFTRAGLKEKLAATHDPEDRRALEAQLRLAEETGASAADVVPEGQREQVTVSDSEILVELPAATPEVAHARRQWAETHDAHTFFKAFEKDKPGFVDAYVKGGPLWIYHSDRDAVMQMPFEWRRDLIADIGHHSPATAHEVGRDLLKATTEQQRDFVEALDA
jgi:hypothetical protein